MQPCQRTHPDIVDKELVILVVVSIGSQRSHPVHIIGAHGDIAALGGQLSLGNEDVCLNGMGGVPPLQIPTHVAVPLPGAGVVFVVLIHDISTGIWLRRAPGKGAVRRGSGLQLRIGREHVLQGQRLRVILQPRLKDSLHLFGHDIGKEDFPLRGFALAGGCEVGFLG